jgi:Ca2+-binding EF-hand superfamily protein
MMKKYTLTTLALMTVSGLAWATGGAASFQELDSNRDGQITLDEAKKSPGLKSNFTQADANKDGKLDAAEFSALEVMPLEVMPKETSPKEIK